MPKRAKKKGGEKPEFKFGRMRPRVRSPRLRLNNYMMRGLPDPPGNWNYPQAAAPALTQVYGNRDLKDCTIAAIAHAIGVFTADAGQPPFEFTDDQIVQVYGAVSGYMPGYPNTDVGCDNQTALNYWANVPLPIGGNHTIVGALSVNPQDVAEIQTAIWMFGNLFLGFDAPDTWMVPQPRASGFIWDTAGPPDPKYGHSVLGIGFDAQGVIISSWGMIGKITYSAIAQYCAASAGGELDAVLSHDIFNSATGKTPSGFDWTQLVADFEAIGGTVTKGA